MKQNAALTIVEKAYCLLLVRSHRNVFSMIPVVLVGQARLVMKLVVIILVMLFSAASSSKSELDLLIDTKPELKRVINELKEDSLLYKNVKNGLYWDKYEKYFSSTHLFLC